MEPLAKAFKDIPMGQKVELPNQKGDIYDYTHVLSPKQRAEFPNLKLYVRHFNPRQHHWAGGLNAYLKDGNEPGIAGSVEGALAHVPPEKHVRIGYAHIGDDEKYQRRGLGRALYTALHAHAAHLGATHITGGVHSTYAHEAHGALAAQHKLSYAPPRNIRGEAPAEDSEAMSTQYDDTADWEGPPAPLDDRYGPYKYRLKSELSMKKALSDIRVGPQVTIGKAGILGHGQGVDYDYSHLLPQGVRLKGYSLEIHDDRKKNQLSAYVHHSNGNTPRIPVTELNGFFSQHDPNTLRVLTAMTVDGHRRQGLGTAAYEAMMAHARNHLGATHIAGGIHTAFAGARHEALSRKHGLNYKAGQGGYKYSLKFEDLTTVEGVELTTLQKTTEGDPIMERLKHGSPEERTLALKEQGVQVHHLIAAMKDRSRNVQKAILNHPLMTPDVVAKAPESWIKSNLEALIEGTGVGDSAEGSDYEYPDDDSETIPLRKDPKLIGTPEAISRVYEIAKKTDYDDRAMDLGWLARYKSTPKSVLEDIAQTGTHHEAMAYVVRRPDVTPSIISTVLGRYIDAKKKEAGADADAPAGDTIDAAREAGRLANNLEAAANHAIKNPLADPQLVEEVADPNNQPKKGHDPYSSIRDAAQSAPTIKGALLDRILKSKITLANKEAREGGWDHPNKDALGSIVKNPNMEVKHFKQILASKEGEVASLVAYSPKAMATPEIVDGVIKKLNAPDYDEHNWRSPIFSRMDSMTPEFHKAMTDQLAKKWNSDIGYAYFNSMEDLEEGIAERRQSIEKDTKRAAEGDAAAKVRVERDTKQLNKMLEGYPQPHSVETLQAIWNKIPKKEKDGAGAQKLANLSNAPQEAIDGGLLALVKNMGQYDNAFTKAMKNPRVSEAAIHKALEAVPSRFRNMDDVFRNNPRFNSSWVDALLRNKHAHEFLSDLFYNKQLQPQDIDKVLNYAWGRGDADTLNQYRAHPNFGPQNVDTLLNLPIGKGTNGRGAASVYSGLLMHNSELINQAHLDTISKTLSSGAIKDKGDADSILAGVLQHPLAPQQLVEQYAQVGGPDQSRVSDAALRNPKLDPAKLHQLVTDERLKPHEARSIINNPSLNEGHIRALFARPEVNAPKGDEHDYRGWAHVLSEALGHKNTPLDLVEKEHERLGVEAAKPQSPEDGDEEGHLAKPKNDGWDEYRLAIHKALSEHHPDKVYAGQQLDVRHGTQKLRVLRDSILDSGQQMVPAAQLPPGNYDRFRVITGNPQLDRQKMISAEKIQQAIDSVQPVRFNWSTTQYTNEMQNHRKGEIPQTVFQLNVNSDMIRQMKQAGVYDTYRKLQGKFNNGIHPVTSNSVGWVRFTGNPKAGAIHVDEVQSDHRQSMTSRELNDKRREYMEEAGKERWGDLSPAQQEEINKKLAVDKIEIDKEYPEEHQKIINKIIGGGADVHDALVESFHNWLFQQHGNVRIHYPSLEFRAHLTPLEGYGYNDYDDDRGTGVLRGERVLNHYDKFLNNLLGAKEAHFKAMNRPAPDQAKDPKGFERHTKQLEQLKANVDTHQQAYDKFIEHPKVAEMLEANPNMKHRSPPAHYKYTYTRIPEQMGMQMEAAKYGDEPTEKNKAMYGGMPMHISIARKKEDDFGFEDLRKTISSLPMGKLINSGRRWFTWDFSHLLSPAQRANGYEIRVGTGPDDDGHYINADILHKGKYVGGGNGVVHPPRYEVGNPTPLRDFHINGAVIRGDDHRGMGLGPAAYEAMMAVAKHAHNATHVVGSKHATPASKVHEKLATKHGMTYQAEANIGGPDYPTESAWDAKQPGSFDNKWASYRYTLKSELWGMPVPKKTHKEPDTWEAELAPHGMDRYNYSHMVPKGYKMYLIHAPHTGSGRGGELNVELRHQGMVVGELAATHDVNGNAIVPDFSRLEESHRGKGLGQKMYEAMYAHAHNALGVTMVRGDSHSDDAHHVHAALAAKHNLGYVGVPNKGPEMLYADTNEWEKAQPKNYNERWGPYEYPIGKK